MELSISKTRNVFVLFAVICLLFYAAPARAMTVIGEGSTSTERTTDIKLSCDAIGLNSDDELVRVTWFVMDQSHRIVSEIFSADLTNDHPAFVFSSNWAGRGMFDSGSLANIRLPSRHVTRDFAGDYRCQVNSLMSSGFVDVSINVLYGPGSSVVIAPGGRVERQEGEELTLACSSQCNPVCSYRWYRAGRQVSTSRLLDMSHLTRDKAGLYACQARNEAGRSIKPVDLRISYPATILALNTSGAALDASKNQKNKGKVESSEDVVFTCEVKGWPEPSIDWTKSSVSNVAISNGSFVTTQLDLEFKLSRFEIKSASCRNNGEYICKAWNNIGKPSSKSSLLNMSCSPFETNHSKSCHQGKEVNYIRNLHERLPIKICFFGNPTPNVTLTQIHEQRGVIKTYVGNISCDFTKNQCEWIFDLNITSPDQYGLYNVKVANNRGQFEKKYFVTSQQPPVLPSTLLVANISQNSACFSWKSGFNGGSKQMFNLKVYSPIKVSQQNDKGDKIKELYVEEDEHKQNAENVVDYSLCATDLIPSTLYEAALSASNKFGVSESPRRYRFTTNEFTNFTKPIPSWLSVSKGITLSRAVGVTSEPFPQKTQISTERKEPLTDQTTKNPHIRLEDYPNSRFSENDEDDANDNNELDLPDLDDSPKKQLSHVLDAYLSINKNKLNPATPGDKYAQLSSNYASHLHQFFINYATAQSQGFRPASITDPEPGPILDNGVTASVLLSEPSLTTPSENPVITSTSVHPVTVSTIFVGVACVLGIVITFGAIAFIKKNHRLAHCGHRCYQRNSSASTQSPFEGSTLPLPREQGTSSITIFNRNPAVTCVHNENVTFSRPATKRPRLSTPDRKLFRSKEKSITSIRPVEHPSDNLTSLQHDLPNSLHYEIPTVINRGHPDLSMTVISDIPTPFHSSLPISSTTFHRDLPSVLNRELSTSNHRDLPTSLPRDLPTSLPRDLPTITFESSRGPCPSYLELHPAENELPLEINNHDLPSDPSATQLEQPQYLIPINRRSSYHSHHQTFTKNLADHDADFYPSYLDLYETLTTRSRSRSPSNIYDPFLSDATDFSGQSLQNYQNYENENIIGEDGTTSSKKGFSISDTQVKENRRTADVISTQQGPQRVQLQPPNTPPSRTKKLAHPPLVTDNEAITNGSYELIDPVSRKYLASRVFLPKPSKLSLDSDRTGNFSNKNFKLSKNLQTKTKFLHTNKEHRIEPPTFPNDTENKYDYSIPLDIANNNPQHNSKMHETNKKQYKERNEFPGNKNANSRNEESKRANIFQQHDDATKDNNTDLKARTRDIFCAQINNNKADISEINCYVEEYTISDLSRDSTCGISHGYSSIYSNEAEVRNSTQSNSSNEFDEPRSRTSSSESDQSIKSPRKIKLDGSPTDQRFKISQSEYFDIPDDSKTARIDLRDSGVSCSYRHDSTRDKNRQMELKVAVRKRLCHPETVQAGSSSNDPVLYEEPFVQDNIYAEVSH